MASSQIFEWDTVRKLIEAVPLKAAQKSYVKPTQNIIESAGLPITTLDLDMLSSDASQAKLRASWSRFSLGQLKTNSHAFIKVITLCSAHPDVIASYKTIVKELCPLAEDTSSTSSTSEDAMLWSDTLAQLQRFIRLEGSVPCKTLAELYSSGYIFGIADILSTVIMPIDLKQPITVAPALDITTGTLLVCRRQKKYDLHIDPATLERIKSHLHPSQKYLFQGRSSHSSNGFHKKTFCASMCITNCQKSYLAWYASRHDRDETIRFFTNLGLCNEATKVYTELIEFSEPDDTENDIEIKILNLLNG